MFHLLLCRGIEIHYPWIPVRQSPWLENLIEVLIVLWCPLSSLLSVDFMHFQSRMSRKVCYFPVLETLYKRATKQIGKTKEEQRFSYIEKNYNLAIEPSSYLSCGRKKSIWKNGGTSYDGSLLTYTMHLTWLNILLDLKLLDIPAQRSTRSYHTLLLKQLPLMPSLPNAY